MVGKSLPLALTTPLAVMSGNRSLRFRWILPLRTRYQNPNRPIALVEQENLAVRTLGESEVGTSSGRSSLPCILFPDNQQERLGRPCIVQQDSVDRILSAFWQAVGIHVENLAAGIVSEDQEIGEL